MNNLDAFLLIAIFAVIYTMYLATSYTAIFIGILIALLFIKMFDVS